LHRFTDQIRETAVSQQIAKVRKNKSMDFHSLKGIQPMNKIDVLLISPQQVKFADINSTSTSHKAFLEQLKIEN